MSARKTTKSVKTSTLIPATVDDEGSAVPARTSFPIPNADQLTEKQLDRRQRNLTTSEFNAQLSLLQKEATDLMRMAVKVGKAGKQGVQTDKYGNIGTKELTALLKRHNKKVKSLGKNYSATPHRRPKATSGEGKKKGGLGQGVFLREPMINFLRSANLGTLKDGTQVSDLIKDYLDSGILARGILTQLLTFYRNNNNMNFEVQEGDKTYKRMRATPEMKKFLGPYLSELESKNKSFDQDNFEYKYLTSLATLGVVPKADLNEEQLAYINDDENKKALSDLQAVLKAGKP